MKIKAGVVSFKILSQPRFFISHITCAPRKSKTQSNTRQMNFLYFRELNFSDGHRD